MGSEAETEANSTAKLPLFSVPKMLSPEPSGMLTPPLQTLASVPFRWEEEPGKPRPCTALITLPIPINKSLELPPRLQIMDYYSKIITKPPSPTTVFDGPYVGKDVFSSSSSFRVSSMRQESSDGYGVSSETMQTGAVLLGKRSEHKGRGLFSYWGKKKKILKGCQSEDGEGSFVISSSSMGAAAACDESKSSSRKVNIAKFRRNGSFSSLSLAKSHFWATMYEGFKLAIPISWKMSRKSKKQVHVN